MGRTHQPVQQTQPPQTGVQVTPPQVTPQVQGSNSDNASAAGLVDQRSQTRSELGEWYTDTRDNITQNHDRSARALQSFTAFAESGTAELQGITGVVAGGIALFGTVPGIVAFCASSLVTGATSGGAIRQHGKALKDLETQLNVAHKELKDKKDGFDGQINAAADAAGLQRILAQARTIQVPLLEENIIYRELLLKYAQDGGYNVSGSQWNVDNMSLFGEAPWYHSWDWGSPGWNNGQDIAEELNGLAEQDPSTRKKVNINPP